MGKFLGLLAVIALTGLGIFYFFSNSANAPSDDFGQTATTTPTPESDETETATSTSAHPLFSSSWQWVSFTGVNDSIVSPKDPSRFILTLSPDRRINSTTDCNSLSGGYIIDGEVLSFGALGATKVACMGETLETTYANALAQVGSYVIEDEMLTLILLRDQGTMQFTRAPLQ